MIETYPLEKAGEAYARMMSGKAQFRVVLDHVTLEPGLVIYKIYSGYWSFGRPTMEELPPGLTLKA